LSKIHNRYEVLLKDKINRVGLRQLERIYGFEIRLLRSEKDVFSTVYGSESGNESEVKAKFDALVTGYSFSPVSLANVGELQEGWLYTSNPAEVFTSDIVEVLRADGAAFRFKVTSIEGIGATETVMKRYRIAAMGEDGSK